MKGGEERGERREKRGERREGRDIKGRGERDCRGERGEQLPYGQGFECARQIVNRMEKITYKSDIRLGETNGELKGGKRREGRLITYDSEGCKR